jgi:hypothetical protein
MFRKVGTPGTMGISLVAQGLHSSRFINKVGTEVGTYLQPGLSDTEMFPLVFPLIASFFGKWEQKTMNAFIALRGIVPDVPTVPTFRR